jgi:hypothetical protein
VSFVLPFRLLLYLSSLLRAVVFILRSRFFSCTSGPRAKGFFFPRSALGVLLSLVRSIWMLLDFSLASCSARIQRLLGSSAWLRFRSCSRLDLRRALRFSLLELVSRQSSLGILRRRRRLVFPIGVHCSSRSRFYRRSSIRVACPL